MASRASALVPLGYGKWARADRIYALVPLEGDERGDGRRTVVHVEGLADPAIASRSERAIAADVRVATGERDNVRARHAGPGEEQPPLF
jgi:hypothetical protein